MTVSLPEDRFRALGMQAPDLSFLRKEVPPNLRWGAEPLYNTRALVGNWYEDRRAYKQECCRCTGHSITRTDYLPHRQEAYAKDGIIPPPIYARKLADEGEGPNLLRNTEDYCDYLENYTTTSDLMHNWEVRRVGCKPKPWRRWKLIQGSIWVPQPDNSVSFGNLTQLGYRKAPQLPLLPNDWDVYVNNPTVYQDAFGSPRYPDHYVHCRRAATKEIRRQNEDMIMIKVPDPCNKCKLDHNKGRPQSLSCSCVCHAIETALKEPKKRVKAQLPYNLPRFSNYMPAGRMKQTPGVQTLHAGDTPFPYRTIKHPSPPYLRPGTCETDCAAPGSAPGSSPVGKHPDICTDYAGDIRRE